MCCFACHHALWCGLVWWCGLSYSHCGGDALKNLPDILSLWNLIGQTKPRMIMIFHSGIYLGYAIYTLAMWSIVTSNQGPSSMEKENYTLGEVQCATIHVCFYTVNSCLYAVLEQRLVLYIPPYFSITSPSMIEVNISFSVFIWKRLYISIPYYTDFPFMKLPVHFTSKYPPSMIEVRIHLYIYTHTHTYPPIRIIPCFG